MKRRGEGKTAEKVRGILEAAGMTVKSFTFAEGFWAREDVYRWEAFGVSKGTGDFARVPAGMSVSIGGWNPMHKCARHGLTLSRDEQDTFGHYEAHSAEAPSAPEVE